MSIEKLGTSEGADANVENAAKEALKKLDKKDWANFAHTVEVLIASADAEEELRREKEQTGGTK